MRDLRAENIQRLAQEPWDVLIIGGGINGAGVARDLAMRSARIPGACESPWSRKTTSPRAPAAATRN